MKETSVFVSTATIYYFWLGNYSLKSTLAWILKLHVCRWLSVLHYWKVFFIFWSEKSSTNAGKQIKSEFEGSQIQRIEQTPNDAFRQNREIERKPHQNIKPAVDVCLGTNRPMLNKQGKFDRGLH